MSALNFMPNLIEYPTIGFLTQLLDHTSAPLIVSLGAVPGALSRYYLTIFFAQRLGIRFPYGTFFINLSGSLLIGFLTTFALTHSSLTPNLQLLLTTGFLGSYTTFSTYALDTATLWRTHRRSIACFYWAGSVVLGGVCLMMGMLLARALTRALSS